MKDTGPHFKRKENIDAHQKGEDNRQEPELVEMTNKEIMELTKAHTFQYYLHFESFPAAGYELKNGILYKVKPVN